MKYAQAKTGTRIIEEFERKLTLFLNEKRKTIVTKEEANNSLQSRDYFDHIIILDELFTTEVQ